MPLKIKLFTWLSAEKKIPTWDYLQQKGWTEPNLCHLFHRDAKTTSHLFIHCHYTRLVWNQILQDNHIHIVWNETSITNCLGHWITNDKSFKLLPPLVNWHIWLARNLIIFEDKPLTTSVVAFKVLGLFHSWKNIHPDIGKKKDLSPATHHRLPNRLVRRCCPGKQIFVWCRWSDKTKFKLYH